MVASFSDAVTAFNKASKMPSLGENTKAAGTGSDFGDFLKNSMNDIIGSQKSSEQVAGQAAMGKANTIDVMTSITNAETNLQLLVGIRDRMVQAYQEIMRMPI